MWEFRTRGAEITATQRCLERQLRCLREEKAGCMGVTVFSAYSAGVAFGEVCQTQDAEGMFAAERSFSLMQWLKSSSTHSSGRKWTQWAA